MIDTHSHLYLNDFDADRPAVIERAKALNINRIILPNIDVDSLDGLIQMGDAYPDICVLLNGLHPTSVTKNYQADLRSLFDRFATHPFKGVGEIGIDLYWDTSLLREQIKAFEYQIAFSIKYDLPIVIHARNSFKEIFEVLKRFNPERVKGVFHSFTGERKEIDIIRTLGNFYFGINGIVTYKNSNLKNVLTYIGLDRILLETDSPYLTPVPFRGKRNESSYLYYICKCISEHLNCEFEEVDEKTSQNATLLFNL